MAVLISWIRRELSEGNPLLGIARLNENFDSCSPIRKAILKDLYLTPSTHDGNYIIEKLLAGSKLAEFSGEEQKFIKQYKKSISIRKQKVIPINIESKIRSKAGSFYSRRAARASKRASNLS